MPFESSHSNAFIKASEQLVNVIHSYEANDPTERDHKVQSQLQVTAPHARSELEDVVEGQRKIVLAAFLNGIHQFVPVSTISTSEANHVEVTVVYAEPLDVQCTAELRHAFETIRQSIERNKANQGNFIGSAKFSVRGSCSKYAKQEDAIGLGFTTLDFDDSKLDVKQVEIREFYKAVMYGRIDYTHALCASSEHSNNTHEARRDSWILYESSVWRELTQRLSFDRFLSLEYFARHSGFALATSQRLKSRTYSLSKDAVTRRSSLALASHGLEVARRFLIDDYDLSGIDFTPRKCYTVGDRTCSAVSELRGRFHSILDGSLTEDAIAEALDGAKDLNKRITIMCKDPSKGFSMPSNGVSRAPNFPEFDEWLSHFRTRLKWQESHVPRSFANVDTGALLPSHDSAAYRALEAHLSVYEIGLNASQILFMCQSGSAMYGLNVDTSDKDYTIVFATSPTCSFMAREQPPVLVQRHVTRSDTQDKSDVVEFSGFDVQKYGEVLLKGFFKYIEPLYFEGENSASEHVDDGRFVYESPLWRLLKEKRDTFMTNRVITQYIKFVEQKLKLVDKPAEKLRQRKNLYYCFSKLFELRRLVRGEAPHVRIRGEERDFILGIRTTDPSSGPLSTNELKKRVSTDLEIAVLEFEKTQDQRPDEGDFSAVLEWVLLARLIYET